MATSKKVMKVAKKELANKKISNSQRIVAEDVLRKSKGQK